MAKVLFNILKFILGVRGQLLLKTLEPPGDNKGFKGLIGNEMYMKPLVSLPLRENQMGILRGMYDVCSDDNGMG